MRPIYLDHNATTPADPAVVDAMLPWFGERFGNASSVHQFGREAKVALEQSRETVAGVINCQPAELYFTSGGTESDNLAVLGTAYQLKARRNHLVIGATEHHAVLEAAHFLQHHHGMDVSILPVDKWGFASAERLFELVSDKTALVSIMHANNETGTIQDIGALAKVAHAKGALFHTDAVQSVGKIPVDVAALDVDLLSLTGHKIYGPKGSGALFIRQGVKIAPLFYGGSHEKKRRPGTENIAGIVGLAKALEIAITRREMDHESMLRLAMHFISTLTRNIPEAVMNSPLEQRVPPTINVSFPGFAGESIILALDIEGIAVSSGSACTSGAVEPSHVLTAMNIPSHVALGAIRFSLGRSTTREQIDHVLAVLPPIINRLRSLSPTAGR
jgi:cysteine desulfurase